MPLQNRVTPFGEIVAVAARGTMMGNRGILHDERRRLGQARWRHPHWVACVLEFRGHRRPVMQPRNYTELFFLDEAVALAAGHRPCAYCRRADHQRFMAGHRRVLAGRGEPAQISAPELDRRLHRDRVDSRSRRQIRFEAVLDDLPDGTFVRLPNDPETAWLVWSEQLGPWRSAGYGRAMPRPTGVMAEVLTPKTTVAVLAAGYRPSVHASFTCLPGDEDRGAGGSFA
jgi:hypothetical protein